MIFIAQFLNTLVPMLPFSQFWAIFPHKTKKQVWNVETFFTRLIIVKLPHQQILKWKWACGNCLNPHCLYAAIRKQTDLQFLYS